MPTDDTTDALREQRAEQTFSTYTAENGEVYVEPDGEPDAEADVWSRWRREDYCELSDFETPLVGLPRSAGTPIRLAYGRVPRRTAVKSAAATGDDASAEPDIGPSGLRVTEEVHHVG